MARAIFGEARGTSRKEKIAVGWVIRNRAEDPLYGRNERDIRAWFECYDIASLIISDNVSDPTHGANHYYDKSIATPLWATHASFRIKIGSFYFHEL